MTVAESIAIVWCSKESWLDDGKKGLKNESFTTALFGTTLLTIYKCRM